MNDSQSLRGFLERTLALAHAALEEPTSERIAKARRQAAEVFPRMRRLEHGPLTMTEARLLIELVTELRTVIGAVARAEAARAAL